MLARVAKRKRHELPPFKKLNISFDIERLRSSLLEFESKSQWDGLSSEYNGLCEAHHKLPQFFLLDGEKPDATAAYQQLALSEFDEDYSLEIRQGHSSTIWDRRIAKNCKSADERFYRKPVPQIPGYLEKTLNYFRPHLHRVRFAKILPGNQVLPHIDYDTTYSIRLHIPIHTDPSCMMGVECKGEKLEQHFPADGSVYFINQGLKHWATNPSAKDRVHLILSVDSQSYLEV